MNTCLICQRLELLKAKKDSALIYEFENSYLILGDHQYFPGYCVLHFKNHVRELHDLPAQQQTALFGELMIAAKAIATVYQPWKMNYSCYGNVVEHIHWHLFPRYQSDPDHKVHPWLHMDQFAQHVGSE